ncbi:3741_t:CDS:2 [Funneliformis geosporum]|uniref:823_t:CDS:1 n=1 Tax=Funneliformis geosporum TaxID=1117311 RepID=A0A9W4SEE5_9GLOM|nr:3741_t:CDS:2 [Funneliformis geosporum]CAI2165485.1 823_t:CDS:2 [Funneliformis geosporum]
MGRLSKKSHIALTKSHIINGTFIAETQNKTNFEEETEGNDDDSEWEEDIDLKPYLIGSTKKSIFYDNYGPSGKWTKAAENTPKLTSFFSLKNKEIEGETDDVEKVL